MAKTNSKSKKETTLIENEINPRNAKAVLLVFGVGPIIILFLFLYLNGFFS